MVLFDERFSNFSLQNSMVRNDGVEAGFRDNLAILRLVVPENSNLKQRQRGPTTFAAPNSPNPQFRLVWVYTVTQSWLSPVPVSGRLGNCGEAVN